jgi:hypothetical protein
MGHSLPVERELLCCAALFRNRSSLTKGKRKKAALAVAHFLEGTAMRHALSRGVLITAAQVRLES